MRTITLLGLAFLGWVGCSSAAADKGDYFAPGAGAGDTGVGDTGAGTSAGAGAGDTGSGLDVPGTGSSGGTATGTATGTSSSSGSSSSGSSGGAFDAGLPPPNLLTAGVWDDSLNYDFFGKYIASHQGIAGDPGFTTGDYDGSLAMFAQRAPHAVVDAALVIDTTGSMADELSYLTSEFASISAAVSADYPGAEQRWALVVYRDTPDTDPGDEYVVRSFDFTSDLAAFAATVGAQTANNGGDYPESPEKGLDALPQLSWRTGASVAKIAFWVGDAPHHDYRAAAMKQAILDVRGAGVHLYPVSASGTDDLLELTMRSAAEMTGGRYLFLTDDSGIGDTHKIPEIPCYFVTKLSKALVRVVSMELAGDYIGPDPADVIRTSGDPSPDGTCQTQDGQTVHIF
jgi:hypothetical protein